MECDPKGEQFACVFGKSVELWSLSATPALRGTLRANVSGVSAVAFSPDGSRLVTCHKDGMAYLWDTAECRLVLSLGQGAPPAVVSLGDDGRLLTCTWAGNRLQVWDGLPPPAAAPKK